MLIKGITQINGVITEEERVALIAQIRATKLNDESSDHHYGNSWGVQINPATIYDRLTETIKGISGLDLRKANAYARIYKHGGELKPHFDREGLDLTLSVQLKNDFKSTPIFGEGYDGTVYNSELHDRDSVLIKGRELKHWRHTITGDPSDELICVFFHWTIVSIEKTEIENFITDEMCDEIIKEQIHYTESMVLYNGTAQVVDSIRSNKVAMYNGTYKDYVNNKLKEVCGNLELEGLQVLKYDKGNKFSKHLDERYNGKERLFTCIIYLADNYVGGETSFPSINYKVTPKKGKLLLWKNIKKDSNGNWISNPLTMHESLPIISGQKFSLVNWMLL